MKAWEYILRLPDGSLKGVEHIVHPDMVVLGMLVEVMVVLGMLEEMDIQDLGWDVVYMSLTKWCI